MQRLPPLPDHIGPLRPDSALVALYERDPGMWLDPEHCVTCLGAKSYLRYTPFTGEVVEYECNCIDQWLLYVHLLNSGIRIGFQRSCWADLHSQVPPEVMETIVGYSANAARYVRAGRGLILRGANGTGKTLLAVLLLKRLILQGYNCNFVSGQDLLDSYTHSWRDEAALEQFRRYISADFLVIDEVHARTVGGMKHVGESMLDHLIRTRTSDDRPTIITTNLTMDQIETGYGHSVISLLTEDCEVIEVTGPDYRPRARERNDIEFTHNAVRPVVLE